MLDKKFAVGKKLEITDGPRTLQAVIGLPHSVEPVAFVFGGIDALLFVDHFCANRGTPVGFDFDGRIVGVSGRKIDPVHFKGNFDPREVSFGGIIEIVPTPTPPERL